MTQRQLIECFHCRTPVDETDLDCGYCGREVALELVERNAISFLLRCTSLAVVIGVALSGFAFAFLLTGFGGHEKTFFLTYVLASCVAGLIWLAGDRLRPTKIED